MNAWRSADLELLGWDERHAVARVKGVKARVGRTIDGWPRWSCAEHGTSRRPHCEHTRALAAEPADPEKQRGPSAAVNNHTTNPESRNHS